MGSSGCVRHPKSERKKPNRLKGKNHENNNHKNNPDRRPAALRPGFCRRRGEKACRGRPSASCKTYTYKESAGKPRKMEIYFPPNHDPAKSKCRA